MRLVMLVTSNPVSDRDVDCNQPTVESGKGSFLKKSNSIAWERKKLDSEWRWEAQNTNRFQMGDTDFDMFIHFFGKL